jgi:membrane-associated protease RseP (regulator of RpoE activity)
LLKPPANAIPSNIGMGLGGNIEGFIGRISSVALGKFDEKNVITYFQQLDTALYDAENTSSRNGVIGNGMLRRFILVLDYNGKEVWLKPGKQYKSEYTYDRSGLSIISSGTNMSTYIIQDVIPNSPATDADIRKGDRIVKIGRKPAFMVTLTYILKKFQGKPGKKVKVTIVREEQRLIKNIVLRDLL